MPVREHVQGDPAAVGCPVVPRRTLRRLPVAFEDPVAELPPYRKNATEKSTVDEAAQLAQPGQEQFVLHDTVLDAGRVGQPGQLDRLVQALGHRFLGVQVLAGLDRHPQSFGTGAGDLRVEVDPHVRAGQRGAQVGGPVGEVVALGQVPQFGLAAADQHRLGPQRRAVPQRQPALLPDGQDRAQQMLPQAHPPGDPVEHDADRCPAHLPYPPQVSAFPEPSGRAARLARAAAASSRYPPHGRRCGTGARARGRQPHGHVG